MTESPTTAKCRRSGCLYLDGKTIRTANGTRTSWYCRLSGRIPGNMARCPLED